MTTIQEISTNRTKTANGDPKYFIVPANFFPKERIPPIDDVGLLRSIMNLDTTMRHSMASYDFEQDPDTHNDTYRNVRFARERIESQIKKDNSYMIINFGRISALARKDQEQIIKDIIFETREDFFAEDRFFGRKVGFHETVVYERDNASHNCWIFLKEDFILFTTENTEQIKTFFLK